MIPGFVPLFMYFFYILYWPIYTASIFYLLVGGCVRLPGVSDGLYWVVNVSYWLEWIVEASDWLNWEVNVSYWLDWTVKPSDWLVSVHTAGEAQVRECHKDRTNVWIILIGWTWKWMVLIGWAADWTEKWTILIGWRGECVYYDWQCQSAVVKHKNVVRSMKINVNVTLVVWAGGGGETGLWHCWYGHCWYGHSLARSVFLSLKTSIIIVFPRRSSTHFFFFIYRCLGSVCISLCV